MFIQNNHSARFAHTRVKQSYNEWEKRAERLASGERINRSGDDASGLALSERMRTQIKGLDRAIRNAGDGMSFIQVAESHLGQLTDILQRMREIAVTAANGIYGEKDYALFQAEVSQLVAEVDRIAQVAEFNRMPILRQNTTVRFHIGPNAEKQGEKVQSMEATIRSMTANDLGLAEQGKSKIVLKSADDAEKLIASVDQALERIFQERAELGSFFNRLETATYGLEETLLNTTQADARIRSADMAREMIEFTKYELLVQSGTAVMAQANFMPRVLLGLLR